MTRRSSDVDQRLPTCPRQVVQGPPPLLPASHRHPRSRHSSRTGHCRRVHPALSVGKGRIWYLQLRQWRLPSSCTGKAAAKWYSAPRGAGCTIQWYDAGRDGVRCGRWHRYTQADRSLSDIRGTSDGPGNVEGSDQGQLGGKRGDGEDSSVMLFPLHCWAQTAGLPIDGFELLSAILRPKMPQLVDTTGAGIILSILGIDLTSPR